MAGEPVMEVYKTDAFLIDADSSGNPSAGDTLRYTITIENTGDQDAGRCDPQRYAGCEHNTCRWVGFHFTGNRHQREHRRDTDITVDLGEYSGAGWYRPGHFQCNHQ